MNVETGVQVGKAKVTFLASDVPYFAKPMSVGSGVDPNIEQAGEGTSFRITTSDDLDLVILVIVWPDASPEVILLDWIDGLQKYQRLKNAGRMGVLTSLGTDWFTELRVMKYANKDSLPTLSGASLSEIANMLESDPVELLRSNGALAVGTREEIALDKGRRRNELAIKFNPGDAGVLAVAYTLTRVLPLMYDFGLPEEDL